MADKDKFYTFKVHDEETFENASPVSFEGGPTSWDTVATECGRHYTAPYFAESKAGLWLVYRSQDEAGKKANHIGEVREV